MFPIARRKLCIETLSNCESKSDVRRKKIESPLARRTKVWIVASKFENVCDYAILDGNHRIILDISVTF